MLEVAARETGKEEGLQQAERALRLCIALLWFWYMRQENEGRIFLEQALAQGKGVAALVRARALHAAAELAWAVGVDMYRAEALTRESLELFQELGDRHGIAISLVALSDVDWTRSQYAVARSQLEEAELLFTEVGDTLSRSSCLNQLARIATAQGDFAHAGALIEESLLLRRALSDQGGIGWVLLLKAEMLFLSGGNPAEAQVLAEQSLALLSEISENVMTFYALRLLGQIRLQQGEQAMARDIDNKGFNAACLEGLAVVLAGQGEPVWAARLWGAAASQRESISIPLPPVEQDTYEHAIAAVRTRLGESTFAAAWVEGRGMSPEQAIAAQVPTTRTIEQPSAPPPRRMPTSPDGLTAREMEVLRLVAQGLPDVQVAEQLVISPRTLNSHLTSIYSKLGVDTRTAATRYAVEHHLV